MARRIRSGRVLYEEAQSNIRTWEAQFEGEQGLESARQVARAGTADALQRAIGLALEVPESSSLRWQATEAIDEWSQRILALGVEQSSSDLAGAIATLKKIPSGTRAFEQARSQIEVWEESLNPPDAESPPPEPPETEPPSRSRSR
jgi:hypothetical protein